MPGSIKFAIVAMIRHCGARRYRAFHGSVLWQFRLGRRLQAVVKQLRHSPSYRLVYWLARRCIVSIVSTWTRTTPISGRFPRPYKYRLLVAVAGDKSGRHRSMPPSLARRCRPWEARHWKMLNIEISWRRNDRIVNGARHLIATHNPQTVPIISSISDESTQSLLQSPTAPSL